MKPKCLYRVLGIRPNSSTETIKSAYRKKAMKYHPDRNPGDEKAAAEYMLVQEAYEVPSDPARRAEYDRTGRTDKPRTSEESELLSILFPILMGEIQDIGSGFSKIEEVDLIDRMRRKLLGMIAGIERQVQSIEKGQKCIKSVLGRISVSEGENLLNSALKHQLLSLEEPLRQARSELDRMTRAKAYLGKCTYRKDGTVSSEHQMLSQLIGVYGAIS